MVKFVKPLIFVLAIVAGSLWVSNAIVWVGNNAAKLNAGGGSVVVAPAE
jgi:hypothetical protein